jgi:hypothetical protein
MIKNGVALVRLSSSPNGCGGGRSLDEFYLVVFEDRMLPTRFWSYAAAFKHLERLQEKARADVA